MASSAGPVELGFDEVIAGLTGMTFTTEAQASIIASVGTATFDGVVGFGKRAYSDHNPSLTPQYRRKAAAIRLYAAKLRRSATTGTSARKVYEGALKKFAGTGALGDKLDIIYACLVFDWTSAPTASPERKSSREVTYEGRTYGAGVLTALASMCSKGHPIQALMKKNFRTVDKAPKTLTVNTKNSSGAIKTWLTITVHHVEDATDNFPYGEDTVLDAGVYP